MAESGFSFDGKYYAYISKDGRLRIWDAETSKLKQEYTPDLHLTAPPSCLQWIRIAQTANKDTPGKHKNETQCIALGTTGGKILIYSVTQAKVESILDSDKNISCLDWSEQYGLFSSNKRGTVVDWDLSAGKARNKYNTNVDNKNKQTSFVSAIKIVPHHQKTKATYIVTVSYQVRLWRFHNGDAAVLKTLGHNAAPKALLALATLNNRSWLIEGSQNERLLSFWDVTITSEHIPQVNGEDDTPSKKKRKKSITEPVTVASPSYNFVLEDAPKHVDANVVDDEGTKVTIAAVTRSGVIHYYEHMLNGASTRPIKPSSTIHVTTEQPSPLPLQCCRLNPRAILIGYTVDLAMVFEKITVDLNSKTQVLIRGKRVDKKKGKKDVSDDVTKLKSHVENNVTYVEPMGGVTRKRAAPGAKIEVPMEERLANLALEVKSNSTAAVDQNLTKLLMQGLHSKDKKIIAMVLQRNNKGVANTTVSSLPPAELPHLLEALLDMATRKTSQCSTVCTWLNAVVKCHSSLLLATANGRNAELLTNILAIFTHRRSHLCQLLNLKGRLALTTAQRAEEKEQHEPILEYNDTSSEEEMEVEKYQSENSENESWDEHSERSAHSENSERNEHSEHSEQSDEDDD